MSHHLGLLAAARSRWDAALAWFETALAAARRAGAHVWLAHAQVETARVLLARNAAGDRSRAAKLVAEALEAAERRGLVAVAEQGREIRSALGARRRGARGKPSEGSSRSV